MIAEKFRDIVEDRMAELGISRVELARRMGQAPSYVTMYLGSTKSRGADAAKAGDEVKEKFGAALGIEFDLGYRVLSPV